MSLAASRLARERAAATLAASRLIRELMKTGPGRVQLIRSAGPVDVSADRAARDNVATGNRETAMSTLRNGYMPGRDADFGAWVDQYVVELTAWWAAHSMKPTDLDPLKDAREAWLAAWPAHVAAQQAAESARQAKDAARAALQAQVRPTARFVQTFPDTTDAERARLGLTVPDRTPSRAAPPTSRPRVRVNAADRLMHTLRISDSAAATRRGKPRGVMGAEVWMALTPAGEPAPAVEFGFSNPPASAPPLKSANSNPRSSVSGLPGLDGAESGAGANGAAPGAGGAGDSGKGAAPVAAGGGNVGGSLPGYRFVALSSSGELRTSFKLSDAGKTVHYAVRWRSTRGAPGPWSEVASATVAA